MAQRSLSEEADEKKAQAMNANSISGVLRKEEDCPQAFAIRKLRTNEAGRVRDKE
jgi:hypothetical protein